jgi:hypothetical protein
MAAVSERRAATVAWGAFVLFVALWLVTAVNALGPGSDDELFVLLVLGYAFVGALVASRQPGNAVGWLLLAIGIALVLGGLADANVSGDAPVAIELSAWLSEWTWYVWLIAAAVFLPLLFPTGRLVSRRWRPALWIGGLAAACNIVGVAFAPGRLDVDAREPVENPLGVDGAGDVFALVSGIGEVLLGICVVLAAASLVVRFRTARGVERQQVKWFAFVGLLASAGLAIAMAQVLFGVQPEDENARGGVLEAVGTVGWTVALMAVVVGIPVATGMAILRHRLYDIDVVINRTLVYGGLTATLLAAYLGLVLLLQLALSPLTEQSDLAIAASTLAVAALFGPLRARIQALVDRRFYRRKYDAALTVAAFGSRLRDEVDLSALDAELRTVVRNTLEPAHVSLWVRGGR